MDFFEYANVALMFVGEDILYLPLIIGALCYLIVFAFQSVGLFVISGREGYKHRWMSFVPVLNTYYIGVCGQKNRLFKTVDTKVFSLIAAILEGAFIICNVIFWIAVYTLFKNNYLVKTYDESIYGQTYYWVLVNTKNMPANLMWAGWCFEYLDKYVIGIIQLVFLFFEVFTLSAFFQTFAARRYMLFTITSVLFPVQGILIFILRNNAGMNYREFIRREQEKQYRMYQQYRQQQFDQNPYNQNPYSRTDTNPYNDFGGIRPDVNNAGSGSPEDPFSEFGGSGGNNNDPFAN